MKELKMFINGKFEENVSGRWIKVLNPSTEEVNCLMPDGTVEDARRAIDAAEKAQGAWEKIPAVERGAYLEKIAEGIRKREKELTDIIVREGGKTQGLANVEVLFTADYLDYMAGWARRYEGEIIQITGEIDKEMMNPTEVDVKHIKKMNGKKADGKKKDKTKK